MKEEQLDQILQQVEQMNMYINAEVFNCSQDYSSACILMESYGHFNRSFLTDKASSPI
jgi:hypothetical protein